MAIKRHRRGNRIYVSEYKNTRVNGKVKSQFIRYIGTEVADKKVKPSVKTLDRVKSTGSTRAGDIGLLWAVAQDLNIPAYLRINGPRICFWIRWMLSALMIVQQRT